MIGESEVTFAQNETLDWFDRVRAFIRIGGIRGCSCIGSEIV
jgi:hypothetical protein